MLNTLLILLGSSLTNSLYIAWGHHLPKYRLHWKTTSILLHNNFDLPNAIPHGYVCLQFDHAP